MPHPFIPVPNTAYVELLYTYHSVVIENTLHFRKASPFSGADLTSLVNTIDAWDGGVTTPGKSLRQNGCVLFEIDAKALDTAASPAISIVPSGGPRNGSGGSTNDMPANLAACMQLFTGLAGRSYRGRLYLPALGLGSLVGNSNFMTVTYQNAAVVSWSLLKANTLAAGFTWCVTSYRNGGAWRLAGVNTDVVNLGFRTTTVCTQRRRLR